MAVSPTGLKRTWSDQSPVTSTKRPRLDSSSVATASQGDGATKIHPIILADCPEHQEVWDRVPVGTLYEVARIATEKNIKLEQIPRKELEKLYGTNVTSVSKLLLVLGCGTARTMEERAAEALDFEADGIVAGDGRTLEHEMGSKHVSGRVHFTAALSMEALIRESSIPIKYPTKPPRKSRGKNSEPAPKTPILSLRMPRFSVSCLFSRAFGSHRFLRVKILERLKYAGDACLAELSAWSHRPIYILGREYRAFVEKDDTIWYYLQGPDLVGRVAQDRFRKSQGDYYGTQIRDNFSLVYWWIPLEINRHQLMCKLITRLHLGVSGTRPGPLITNVTLYEDIIHEVDGKEVVFTDGSGMISTELATKLWEKCAASKMEPAAYQIRLSTSKGVVQVAPDIQGMARDGEWIYITQSMLKARHGGSLSAGPVGGMSVLDAAHHVACVVKSATCRHPARLSFQLIPILCEQGVPLSAIQDLQKRTVLATIKDLRIPTVNKDNEPAIMAFAKAIQRYAHLVYNTLLETKNYEGGNFRQKYAWKQESKWVLDDVISSLEKEDGNANHADMILCRNAQLYLAVTCGLNIRGTAYFMEIWKHLLKKAVQTATMSFKIEVPGSVYCTIVPDFTGQLAEGEISFTPPINIGVEEMNFTIGEVLVGRHPAYLPTDVRKVRLASVPALRKRRGVIYFSTKGRRPLADLLAGGDYDGDDVILIWEPSLVAEFQNADDRLSEKPDSVEQSFEREPITAGAVHDILVDSPHGDRGRILSEYLLGSLKVPNQFGRYNTYFLRAVHRHGLSSLEARILGHKFNTLIDAPRTSFRLKPEVRIQDEKDWGALADPVWKRKKDEYERGKEEKPDKQLLRRTGRINVLDELYNSGCDYHEEAWLEAIGVGGKECIYDKSQREKLAYWWNRAEKMVAEYPAMKPELDMIKNKVLEAKNKFDIIQVRYGGTGIDCLTEKNTELIELAHWFTNSPSAKDVPHVTGVVGHAMLDTVRASYAFILDSTTPSGGVGVGTYSGFCWMMAIAPLLSSISSQPITISFPTFSMLTPHSSFCEAGADNDR